MRILSKQFEMENIQWIKKFVLIALCLQNASYTLLRKYSSMSEKVSSKEVLLVGEFIKLFTSIYFINNSEERSSSRGEGFAKLVWLVKHSSKMLILSTIYLVMNVLSFVSLQYIGAGEFTVCAQLKILTTATFSVLVLGTSINYTKWRALAQLVVGCILVTSPSFDSSFNTNEIDTYNKLTFGYGAVLLEVFMSGFASIYFEKVVKSPSEVITIWERNFQLCFYSIIIYSCMIFYESDSTYYPLANWSITTVIVAFLGAGGGLLVAGTLKYADSILKTLATAGAIIISTILSYFFLGSKLDHIIVLGSITTILSIFNYTMQETEISSTISSNNKSDVARALDSAAVIQSNKTNGI